MKQIKQFFLEGESPTLRFKDCVRMYLESQLVEEYIVDGVIHCHEFQAL